VENLFASLPEGLQTLSINRYIGILHTQIDAGGADSARLTFRYDPYYCAFFGSHPSGWRLWLADPLKEKLQSLTNLSVLLDGAPAGKLIRADFSQESIHIKVPEGLGRHTWELVLPSVH
jgi:hypothetical protein